MNHQYLKFTTCYFLFLCMFSQSASAESTIELQWFDTNGNIVSLNWPTSRRWIWKKTGAEGPGKKPVQQIKIDLPRELRLAQEAENSSTTINNQHNQPYLLVDMQSWTSTVQLHTKTSAGKTETVGLSVKSTSLQPEILIDESCDSLGVEVKPILRDDDDLTHFFYAAVICKVSSSAVKLYVIHSNDSILRIDEDPEDGMAAGTNLEWILFQTKKGAAVEGTFSIGDPAGVRQTTFEISSLPQHSSATKLTEIIPTVSPAEQIAENRFCAGLSPALLSAGQTSPALLASFSGTHFFPPASKARPLSLDIDGSATILSGITRFYEFDFGGAYHHPKSILGLHWAASLKAALVTLRSAQQNNGEFQFLAGPMLMLATSIPKIRGRDLNLTLGFSPLALSFANPKVNALAAIQANSLTSKRPLDVVLDLFKIRQILGISLGVQSRF